MTAALLAPGYGGTAEQPLLKKLGARLEAEGIATARMAFSTRRPSRGYATEKQELRDARDLLVARAGGPVALVGRSYGGRMCAFLAADEPPDALVILGHPISPPDRPRPADETALLGLTCPTLVVQGEHDALGPLAVLERIAGQNPRIDLVVVRGAGHEYGKKEGEAIEAAVRWLGSVLRD
ncbi:MAG TPA: alpha/beta family hydrolase [Candidatus Saccharimonadales bacterium]|nr:alpha/beta family hydrolase [Candidatus Saccharimonadales bacterium]